MRRIHPQTVAVFTLVFSTFSLLRAQTYLTAGDNRLSLAQVLRLHPEGMILCLPSSSGQRLEPAIESALDQEPVLALQLTSQEMDPKLKAGSEFLHLEGWNTENSHWALVGPDQHIYAEGTTAPTAVALREAYRKSSLHTRAEILTDFLKANRDHTEGWALLILETRSLAERRTELALATKVSSEAPAQSPERDQATPGRTRDGSDEKPAASDPPPPLLREDEDSKIWGEYAPLYERFIKEGDWLNSAPLGAGPIPLAGELSSLADRSPRLRALALELLPEVEEQVRNRPSDEHRWQVWMSLRNAAGGRNASQVLEGLKPLPGARRWPPAAALNAFVEDARRSGDWRQAEPLLQASFDQNMELLRAMESAALEDANLGWAQAHGGVAGGEGVTVQMGNYLGFGGWNSDVSDLLEAKMKLGKNVEADKVFQELWARVPKPATARSAAALARECGAMDLADKWERLAR